MVFLKATFIKSLDKTCFLAINSKKGINQGNTLIKFSKTFYFTKPLKWHQDNKNPRIRLSDKKYAIYLT